MHASVSILAGLLLAVWSGQAVAQDAGAARVLARVNGVAITAGDVERRLQAIGQDGATGERQGPVLRSLIREELLLQAAGKSDLERQPDVQARLELARRQVLIDEFLRRGLVGLQSVSEEDLSRAYLENVPQFVVETVQVSHIMVATQAAAEAIRQELLAGKDFAELARARSQDDGSAAKGGDLGPIAKGDAEPAFEAAAFRLKPDELSEVVQTEHGFHVLRGGQHGTRVRPFEEVREELRQALAQARQREGVQKILTDLERGAAVEILDGRFK
jgi:peptidyl-prolyl cis-trans isomerase C